MFKKQIDYSVNRKKMQGTYISNADIERLVPSNSRVLDIGCATGKLARALKRKGCIVTGIDIDETSLRLAAKYCQKTYKINVDDLDLLNKTLKGQKFDCITLGDILEHLKYPGALLYQLKKYLTPKGLVVASIPNSAFIWMRARFLLGNFDYNEEGGLMDEDHLHFFSFRTAKLLFEDAQYKVIATDGSNHGIVNTKYWFVKYLAKIAPTLFAIHIVVLAQNKK